MSRKKPSPSPSEHSSAAAARTEEHAYENDFADILWRQLAGDKAFDDVEGVERVSPTVIKVYPFDHPPFLITLPRHRNRHASRPPARTQPPRGPASVPVAAGTDRVQTRAQARRPPMRDIFPVKHYRDEGFVEGTIEIDEKDLQEIIEDYLSRHA